ncbi:MAG TPA: PAS domain S-box protein, partial [Xanthobacteraceae bacterium]|nr:PAS domain S-box protein [Xanthobacteraceae bacterium]
ELSYVFRDGTVRVTDISFVPIKDEAGRVMSVFVPGTDITDRARQYRATFENAGVGIAHLSPDVKQWLRVNGTFARIVGYQPDELVSKSEQEITHPDDLKSSFAEDERLRSGKVDSYEMEKRYVRKDGTAVWVHITGTAVRRNDGSVDHFVAVIQDISERKRAEEQVGLLLGEMNHRSKNLLTLVQVVARQTAVSDAEQQFIDRFTDRVRAIAANQDLLVRTSWRGVDVHDLVCAQLAHFSDLIGHRISLDGPKLRLNGAAAQAIGMALHELATNASKYGALSTDAGHVNIGWFADGLFKMNWIERKGPPVRPPDRRGFGTTVMEAMAKQAVDGTVQLEYDTAGVAWHLTCPAANALERR